MFINFPGYIHTYVYKVTIQRAEEDTWSKILVKRLFCRKLPSSWLRCRHFPGDQKLQLSLYMFLLGQQRNVVANALSTSPVDNYSSCLISVSVLYSLNPDPAKNLNPDPDPSYFLAPDSDSGVFWIRIRNPDPDPGA